MKRKKWLKIKPVHLTQIFLWLCFTLPASTLVAQPVKGSVSDKQGKALTGVTVHLKGSNKTTTTDNAGNYQMDITGRSILVFSFVGFTEQEVVVSPNSVVNILLETTTRSLDEVIVTALGIRKESKRLGYSATTLKTDELTVNRTTNVGNSLQGKVAGVAVSPVSTGAGGSSKIRIRGISSFSGNNSPLIIINGTPISNSDYSNTRNDNSTSPRGNSFADGGDGLLSVNPDDIETLTVLKGAAAAALYGFRAKDGAIVITTKSGKKSKGIGVEYNSNIVVDRAIDQTDFQYEYGEGEHSVRPTTIDEAQNHGTWSFGEKLDGKPTIQFDGQTKPYSAVRNRINKFYQTGYTWNNTVAFSGGSENGNYRVSLSDLKNQSIMPNSGYERQSVDFGMGYDLGKKLSVGLNGNYVHEFNNNPPSVVAQFYNPNITVYNLANSIDYKDLKDHRKNDNGYERSISRFTTRTEPYWWTLERFERIKRDRLYGNVYLKYNILDWLYIQGRASQDYYTRSHEYNIPTGTRFLSAPATPGAVNGEYYQEVIQYRERNYDFLINANHRFHDIVADLTFGGNQLAQISMNNNVLVNEFFIPNLYTVANGAIKDPQYYYSEKRVNSLYGAAEIDYKTWLYLTFTARNDWFSTLNPKSNNYLYPSASASLIFSELLRNPSWLSYGKLRAAYAEVGGDTDPYQNNLNYGLQPSTLNGVVFGYITNSSNPNPSLRPLKVKELEFGLETRLLHDRITIDIAYYDKKTVDQILPITLSTSTGYSSTVVNLGKLQNRGFEFLLGGTPVKGKNFSWDLSLNGSYNASKVVQLTGGQPSVVVGTGEFDGQIAEIVGKPLAMIQGFSYKHAPDGQIINQNGIPVKGPLADFGSALPTWVGGLSNSFVCKGIRISFLIDGRFGGKMFSQTNYNLYRTGLSKQSLPGRAEGGVIGVGVKEDPANAGKYIANDVKVDPQTYYNTVRSNNNVEPFIYKSDFIKLRQITIGYDFSKYFHSSCPVKGLIFSLVANNVWVIKKYTPNIDPEMVGQVSDRLIGLESGSMPITRSLGLNLNVKF